MANEKYTYAIDMIQQACEVAQHNSTAYVKKRYMGCKRTYAYIAKMVGATLAVLLTAAVWAQRIDSLDTARDCAYMSASEKEMIYEINRLRSDPKSYLPYLYPLQAEAKKKLHTEGKGERNYSLTISSNTINGKTIRSNDTAWHYANEEELKALNSLIADLEKGKPLSVLQPDSGIYLAAKKHAADQAVHSWKLLHTGSDGWSPYDRIKHYSPRMQYGSENIGGRRGYASNTPRDMVLQLLIDSGIPGYGHRYNLLVPHWTHAACVVANYEEQTWCIQNFGMKAIPKQ